MTANHEQAGPDFTGPPPAGDEAAILLGSLERQRAIFAWKCGGLDASGLRATLGPSSMTLGGLLKHLALVEDEYFSHRLPGREPGAPWDTVDWDADPDWEWHSAAEDSPAELMTLWQDAVARSRAAVAEALADGELDQLAARAWLPVRRAGRRRGRLLWPGGLVWPVVAGLVLMAAGIGLRAWSIVTLGRFFQYQIKVQPGHQVVTGGPYRYVRHPSYTGIAMVLAGIALASGDVWSLLAVAVLGGAGLAVRIRAEERQLTQALGGEYERFAAGRKRLVPGVW